MLCKLKLKWWQFVLHIVSFRSLYTLSVFLSFKVVVNAFFLQFWIAHEKYTIVWILWNLCLVQSDFCTRRNSRPIHTDCDRKKYEKSTFSENNFHPIYLLLCACTAHGMHDIVLAKNECTGRVRCVMLMYVWIERDSCKIRLVNEIIVANCSFGMVLFSSLTDFMRRVRSPEHATASSEKWRKTMTSSHVMWWWWRERRRFSSQKSTLYLFNSFSLLCSSALYFFSGVNYYYLRHIVAFYFIMLSVGLVSLPFRVMDPQQCQRIHTMSMKPQLCCPSLICTAFYVSHKISFIDLNKPWTKWSTLSA